MTVMWISPVIFGFIHMSCGKTGGLRLWVNQADCDVGKRVYGQAIWLRIGNLAVQGSNPIEVHFGCCVSSSMSVMPSLKTYLNLPTSCESNNHSFQRKRWKMAPIHYQVVVLSNLKHLAYGLSTFLQETMDILL